MLLLYIKIRLFYQRIKKKNHNFHQFFFLLIWIIQIIYNYLSTLSILIHEIS
jgi:hypothetical protein